MLQLRNLCKLSITCGFFLDFQKTFDTVDHRILLEKLEYYGVKEFQMNGLFCISVTEEQEADCFS